MLPVKLAFPAEGKKPRKAQNLICITLRQWAILFSILIFIITAIVTTCTVLGSLHTKQLLRLLQEDIEEEHFKYQELYDRPGISLNESRLRHSQDVVLTFNKILSICMWISWLNLLLSAILTYGVTTKTSFYIIPWLFFSAITFLLALTTVITAYLKLIPGLYISFTILLVYCAASLIFLEMWYTILLYYVSLRSRCSRYSFAPNLIVHSYGGYTHTIQSSNDLKNPLI